MSRIKLDISKTMMSREFILFKNTPSKLLMHFFYNFQKDNSKECIRLNAKNNPLMTEVFYVRNEIHRLHYFH